MIKSKMNNKAKIGDLIDGEVARITNFGAFVKLSTGERGLIHISQVSDSYVKDVNEHLKVGDKVKAKVVSVASDGKIDLSLKAPQEPVEKKPEFKFQTFESKLKKFLKESQERQADIKKNIENKVL